MLPVKYWKFSSPLTRSASSPCSAIAALALAHLRSMSAVEKADHCESFCAVMPPSCHIVAFARTLPVPAPWHQDDAHSSPIASRASSTSTSPAPVAASASKSIQG